MNVKSLGYRSDFIFNNFDGSVEDKGDYFVARTASNPNYFWGNLLLYKKPPQKGDLDRWKSDFKKEFKDRSIYHMTLAWDSPTGEEGSAQDFIDDGFELDTSIVLSTSDVNVPPKFNQDIDLKVISTKSDFEECIQVQLSCANDEMSLESWEVFYRKTMSKYQDMISAERGLWFGATLDGKMVGSLGLFTDGEVGRYQIVSTRKEFQRKGVCSTLVYKSAQYALEKMGVKTLVMVADEEYHAAKIYESVGFLPTEKQIGLCWWDKKRHR